MLILIRPLPALTIVLTFKRMLRGHRPLALLLATILFTQAIVPPSFASSYVPVRAGTTTSARPTSRIAADGFTRPASIAPPAETFGVVLTALNTAFNDHAGIDYHQQSRSIIVSAHSSSSQPHNFELIDGGGAHQAFSNISNLGGALKIATARDDGQGVSLGGFRKGEMFTGTGVAGVVARVAPDGAAVQNPWVTLSGETGTPAGLHVDRTGVFGGDLIVVTDAGGVWRINANGVAARVSSLNMRLSGVTTIPDDAPRYGPWAGKILAGAREQGAVYAIDTQGGATSYALGVNPAEIELIPAHENFFGLDPAEEKLWGAPADAFATLIGDILIAQESPGVLTRVRWNGTEFQTRQIAQVAKWGQITFAPAGIAEIRGVKQVYDKLAVVRHAPVLNSGRVEGALWQLNAENIALGGSDVITSDLLVPGSPNVTIGDGKPTFAGLIEGVEDAQPAGYSFSIGGNASLRHLITRTNPIELETVNAPPAPAGTRDVSITKEDESVGEFSTLRDLSLSGKTGAVSVPPGTYGSFSLSGRTILVLGVENSTEPTVYNLQSLTLTGGSELRLAGPVALTVKNGVSLTGSTLGAADSPRQMLLKVAGGGVKVGGSSVLYGVVRAPRSLVEISGRSRIRGTVTCDRLNVNGGGVLQITESDITPPPVNRPPTADAGADQTITLPSDTVSLMGIATDDGLPEGGTLTTHWTKLSGPGTVTFADAGNAITTAAFSDTGLYVLRLRASDSLLTSDDEVSVEVIARNQPPIVNAGIDQTIELPNAATLNGTASDDALPRNSTLTTTWSAVSGPGVVSFANPDRLVTTATFSAPGAYVLRLTGDDMQLTAGDEMTIVVKSQPHASRVYTLNADFDEGSYINVTHDTPDQLQLDEKARTLNFIWVAVSSKGTVVKIDTETGAILGEYFTSPEGQPRNPSRTTVDQNGNVWATNRDGNSVVHIGLVENGQCIDRNKNGVIDTSKGYGDLRPWTNAGWADSNGGVSTAQDECVIHYTRVSSYGTRHVSVTTDNDIWVSGTGGQRFDLIDGKTGLIKRSEPSVGYGGYGGLIDKNGVIWSARYLMRWDTSKPLTGPSGGNWRGYNHDSYGLCIDSKGNVWNTSLGGDLIHKFAPDGTHLGTFKHGSYWAQGCVVGKNDDVWVAHSLYDVTVGHLKNNGVFVGNVPVGSGPTGVAVDSRGKVWATNHYSGTVSRIDPNLGPIGADGATTIGAVDLTTAYLGGYLYNYSDMTGSTLSGAPDQGTWTSVFDSRVAGMEWGRINWTAKVCGDGLLTVSVATSEDGASFGQPLTVSNGEDPEVSAGRYLKVIVKFERASSGESPVLYDLSVGTIDFSLETPANVAPEVDAGADQTIEGILKTTLRGAACDDGLPGNRRLALSWHKVSGPGTVTFARPNSLVTEVAFSVPGIYELKLTADDSAYTRSDTISVEVVPGNEPPVVKAGSDQAVTHPESATLNGVVTDDGLPRGGSLLITWSKVSGPGGVTFGNPNAASTSARFGAPGAYVLRLTASDSDAAGHDEITVTVGGSNQQPIVNAGSDSTVTLPNIATLDGKATDDGWPEGNTLAVTWSKVSGPGAVSFNNPNQAATTATFGDPGEYVLRLSATDSLLSASDEVSVTVNPSIPPPVVFINGLPDGAAVTDRVSVTGTVSEGSNWRLEYTHGDDGPSAHWTTLASGNTPVNGGMLGVFDPTLLLNGTYTLRLVATDAAAQTSVASVSLIVEGGQKLGHFSLSFSDLKVPLAGLPIEVIRTYDSRDKRNGDFGTGWTLGIRNLRLEKSDVIGSKWEQTQSGGIISTYCLQPKKPHFVTITLPDGKVYKFRAVASPQCSVLTPIQSATIAFLPLAGTHGSLVALGENDTLVFGDAPGDVELRNFDSLEVYDPTVFRFTTQDGTIFVIDQTFGVRSVTDANGNTLTINADGVTHSSGKSIRFTRDAQGRISRITDPAGASLNYEYDGRNDLVAARDRENNAVTFTYDDTHRLLTIKDPLGVQPARNEYDEDGRLVKHIDAFGREVTYERDLDVRREAITDRLGNVKVFDYDARGRVVRRTDPNGGVTLLTYDERDNVLSMKSPAGLVTSYTYDGLDRRTSETDPLGNTIRYTYNSRGQVLTVTDAQGRVTTWNYDANGNPTSVVEPSGNTSTTTYDSRGLTLSETDPLGNRISYEYDSSGNITKLTDPLGRAVTQTFDANGNHLTKTFTRRMSDGGVETLTTSYEYNRLNRPVKITYPDGSTTESIYDAAGRLVADVDKLKRRTAYDYDEMGRLVRTTFPDGTKEESVYDAEGRLVKAIDGAGRAATYSHDALGRLWKTTYSNGSFMVAEYDNQNNITSMTDARGSVTRFAYDANGQRTKMTDADGNVTTYSYDASGKNTSQTTPAGQTTHYEYDTDGRRTRIVYNDGTSQTTAYDAAGRVTSKTDQAGNVTAYEYDGKGNLIKATDALGGITRYTYDEGNNLLTQTDANNSTTTFEYDWAGRPVKRTLPLGMSETYRYNIAGLITSSTDFRGRTTTYNYDAMNRVVSKTPQPGLGEATVTFTYTATGQRATMTDASGTTRYTYNEFDKLLSKQTPNGTLSYTYDASGNPLTLRSSNAGGVSIDYSYDALGRLAGVADNRLPQGTGTTAYAYDPDGKLESTLYPNGVRTGYSYDAIGRLTNINASKSGTTLASYAYTLGAAGNRLAVTEHTGRTVSYAYDALFRLTQEQISGDTTAGGTINYSYDPTGNRLTRVSDVPGVSNAASTYDANDRLGGQQYDANGNMIAANSHIYAYDFENRLTEVDGGTIKFVYDGDGNRVSKSVGGVTTFFLVDTNNHTGHAQVVEELRGGVVVRQYTYGHDLISQRQVSAGDWKTSFYSYDGQGSVTYLTDASGAVTDTYAYDAFGTLIARTGSTPNHYLYTGEQFDADLGFYYLRARHYDPSAGRFTSMDTYGGSLTDPLSLHKYAYVQNNAPNLIDPSGHQSMGEMLTTSAMVGMFATINSVVYGLAQYYWEEAFLRGTNVHKAIYPYYRNFWFICNEQIGTVEKPPEIKARPDARHPGPGYFTGEVYEFKSASREDIGREEADEYIVKLMLHTPGVRWRRGRHLLAPPLIRVPQFPTLRFLLDVPAPYGVLTYEPMVDWEMASVIGLTAATLTMVFLMTGMAPSNVPPQVIKIGPSSPAPLPAPPIPHPVLLTN